MKYRVLKVVAILVMFLIVIYGAYLKFSNPDMTETRLLITYWKQHVLMVLGIITSMIVSVIADCNTK